MSIATAITRLSSAISAIERVSLITLMAAIALFVLTNVFARAIGITIAWADEIAVYAMMVSGFFGASLMLRGRIHPAVLLVHEVAPPWAVRVLSTLVSLVSVGFGLVLLYTAWRWFDPMGLLAAGFDVAAFEGANFNFIYTDVTPIMGVPTFWFYLVIPWFGLTVTIHALANLGEDLGLAERPENPAKINATEI